MEEIIVTLAISSIIYAIYLLYGWIATLLVATDDTIPGTLYTVCAFTSYCYTLYLLVLTLMI